MIKLIFCLLVLASINSLAVDPVQDYLSRNTFPTRNSKFDGQLFAGQSWNGDNHQQPPGGYLLRFDAPIGSNGGAVTFIASSLNAFLRGSNWYAYSKGSGLLSDQVSFGHLNFYLAPATAEHGPVLCEISAGKKAFGVVGVCLDSSDKLVSLHLAGSPRDQDKEYADPSFEKKEEDALIQQNQLTPFAPKMERILLAEYLKNPSADWRLFKDKSFRGQPRDADEKARVDAFKNFHKEDAAQMWKSEKPASTSQQTSQ